LNPILKRNRLENSQNGFDIKNQSYAQNTGIFKIP
jgi:hypothetical protein